MPKTERTLKAVRQTLLATAVSLVSACGTNIYDEIQLMPSPSVYSVARFDPFQGVTAANAEQHTTLFYATDRMPSGPEDRQAFYSNERGHLLRAGIAKVQIDPPVSTWDDLRRITLAGERQANYTLSVSEARETGVMPFSIAEYISNSPSQKEMDAAGRQFARMIDAQLAGSSRKDVFIYVHGYNVDFDYSTLVSKELQHYLGYQGAFISYNWTATPNRLAYFRDQESAQASRRNLRSLIEYLSQNTGARRIHLIGYSAGSRLAFETAYQIALQPEPRARLGRLILISSDLDRSVFLQAIKDNLLDAVSSVTLYQSQTDSALALSRFVFGRERLGQTADGAAVSPVIQAKLSDLEKLQIIDVTDAEEAGAGNGHWYFQSSPWASSDLFLSLLTDRSPAERGLVRLPGEAVWRFPSNYLEILKSRLPVN